MTRVCTILGLLISVAGAAEFHVTTGGSSRGDGSIDRPWDLATALAAPAAIQPGDTLWLHEGVYRGGFVSKLEGRPDAAIFVRARPGERVTIDLHPRDARDNSLLLLAGADTVYRDFEVTCTHPTRQTSIAGSWPSDIRRGAVDIRGSRISAVNLIVHDLGSGFGFWAEGEGGEISGCLIYNNGWQGPDRAHGHGIYAQNARGTKRIRGNIVFHQFAYGIHAYGSEKAALEGFEIDGNICFSNGALSRGGESSPGIMVGGGTPVRRLAVRDNCVVGGGMRFGYPWGVANDDLLCTGNYCDGGLVVRDFHTATVRRNTIVNSSNVLQLEAAAKAMTAGLDWDENDCYVTDGRWGECAIVEEGKSRGLTFAEWQSKTSCDGNTTFTKGSPARLRVLVQPNPHERGRAHLAIINPESFPEVECDLNAVLAVGQEYDIVSVKDYFGPSLVSSRYNGQSVLVPMQDVKGPAPIGMSDAKIALTERQFAAFVVRPR